MKGKHLFITNNGAIQMNDAVKERRKKRPATRKKRKENVDRTHYSTLVKESKKAKKTSKYTTNMYVRETTVLSSQANRPKVKSQEAQCGKCTNLNKMNLKATRTSKMEALLLRLAKKDSREH